MALSPDEIGNLTLVEFEAIASRFEAAVKTIREAQSLLGGGVQASGQALAGPPQPLRIARPTTKGRGLDLTEEEIAQRASLLAANRGPPGDPEFPPSIAEALGGD